MSTESHHSVTAAQATFGSMLLGVGIGILGLAAWDNTLGLPWAMPRFWHSQRTTCVALGVAAMAWGFYSTSRGPRSESRAGEARTWRPTRPGRRFRSAVVYSREGCHLCDEAVELLSRYSDYLPGLQEIDIDADPQLKEKFDTQVPVIEFDGRVRFRGRVSEVLLRRLIEGTPPKECA